MPQAAEICLMDVDESYEASILTSEDVFNFEYANPQENIFPVGPDQQPVVTQTFIPQMDVVYSFSSQLEDAYNKLTLYRDDITYAYQEMSISIASLPCACADHGSASQTLFSSPFETSIISTGVIFSSSNSSEDHHEHCKTCGECLKDGVCPKCSHKH